MRVKRFFAPDMSSAMRLVRDEVGPDAVILSNNSVAGGVEVVVALEYSEVMPSPGERSPEQLRKERQLSALTAQGKPKRLRSELGRTRTALASSQELPDANSPPYLKTHKDRQLELDDAVWDDVLASLQDRRRGASAGKPVRPSSVAPRSQRPGAPLREIGDAARRQKSAVPASARIEPSLEADSSPHPSGSGEQQMLQQMRNEIDELKALLRSQAQVKSAPQSVERSVIEPVALRQGNPLRERIQKRLLRLGLDEALAERLVQAIEGDMEIDRAWKVALSRLAEALPTVGENITDRGGILAFVGATGVGKTTTIGKLAAQYVLKHGSSSVALVTIDCYRIAAHEQLRTFGRILDIPVRVVDERRSLDDALHSLRDKRLVLVDTAGLSMSPAQRQEQLEILNTSSYRIKKFLVLPCTAQYRVLQISYDHFKDLGLNGAVLSKVDESVSLGEAISMVVEQRLPVAYLGDGQKIPDNIEVARANTLVSRAVVLAETQARADKQRIRAESGQGSAERPASLGTSG